MKKSNLLVDNDNELPRLGVSTTSYGSFTIEHHQLLSKQGGETLFPANVLSTLSQHGRRTPISNTTRWGFPHAMAH